MQFGFTQMGDVANGKHLVAVSPHLDDVVLGCADLVAAHLGALVVTVTAGRPGPHDLTDWDRKCGFGPDDDVVGARRAEDTAALSRLGARPVWLDFLDRQYAPGWSSPPTAEVAAALVPLAVSASLVASPLGMLHPDHVAVAEACYEVARSLADVHWVVYEDAIYRATEGAHAEAISRVAAAGFTLEEIEMEVVPERVKRAAIECYASQVKALAELLDDAFRPERYWRLER